MAPHWLDDVFEDGGKSSSEITARLLAHDRFKAAVTEALDAKVRSEEQNRKTPGLKAPSPE